MTNYKNNPLRDLPRGYTRVVGDALHIDRAGATRRLWCGDKDAWMALLDESPDNIIIIRKCLEYGFITEKEL